MSAGASERYDVCIIGAGAAGLVLAEQLSREPSMRVCLIEAGPAHFRDRKEPFRVRSVLKEHVGVNEGRVTAFGGATNTWGGGLIRLSPPDFEAIEGRPDTRWPVGYAELEPHYAAVEALFGIDASRHCAESVFIDRPGLHVRRRPIAILPFRSKNFARRFGPTIAGRANVTVRCNAAIRAFVPAGAGGVEAVEFDTADAGGARIAARNFVIAAGIVNTNLLAERVFAACGSAGAPGRGEYFHDHVSFPVALLRPKSQGRFSRRFGYRFEHGLMFGEHFDIELRGKQWPGAFLHLAFDTSTSSILRPVRDVLNAVQQRTLRGARLPSFRELGALLIGLPRLGFCRYVRRRLFIDRGTRILATLDIEQYPLSKWTIRAEGQGCAVSWDVSDLDAELSAALIPICHEVLERLKAEADFEAEVLIPDPAKDPRGFLDHLRKHSVDTLHSSGGLRMGTSPDSPVDADLRLAGVPNVHALSAAVFPRVGTSNPTLTILALGHRLGVRLLREHAPGGAADSGH